jgi:hypothetical protein
LEVYFRRTSIIILRLLLLEQTWNRRAGDFYYDLEYFPDRIVLCVNCCAINVKMNAGTYLCSMHNLTTLFLGWYYEIKKNFKYLKKKENSTTTCRQIKP